MEENHVYVESIRRSGRRIRNKMRQIKNEMHCAETCTQPLRKTTAHNPAHNHAHKLSAQPCAQPLRTTPPAQEDRRAQGNFFPLTIIMVTSLSPGKTGALMPWSSLSRPSLPTSHPVTRHRSSNLGQCGHCLTWATSPRFPIYSWRLSFSSQPTMSICGPSVVGRSKWWAYNTRKPCCSSRPA